MKDSPYKRKELRKLIDHQFTIEIYYRNLLFNS